MANYAEELVYWYLRLNGFFPMTNFVYHRLPRQDEHGTYNADADILAIRPPYYKETIFSGESEKNLISDDWLQAFDGKWVGLIGEVKGSRNVPLEQVTRAFSPERLRVAIMRLGLLPGKDINGAVDDLSHENQHEFGEKREIILLKVLFADTPTYPPDVMNSYLWKIKDLKEIDRFIRLRINQFPDPKSGGRYFFPSSFFQYIVWSERHEHFDE
jgi:hypothetical protein